MRLQHLANLLALLVGHIEFRPQRQQAAEVARNHLAQGRVGPLAAAHWGQGGGTRGGRISQGGERAYDQLAISNIAVSSGVLLKICQSATARIRALQSVSGGRQAGGYTMGEKLGRETTKNRWSSNRPTTGVLGI